MLSVVVCMSNPERFEKFKKSLAQSIGVDYELITIDNSRGNYSIFEAYNKGEALAEGDIVCFSHEDIIFRTEGWGMNVERYFAENPDLGVLGVVGGHACYPGKDWRLCPKVCSNMIQWLYLPGEMSPVIKSFDCNIKEGTFKEVVAVDGMWLCVRKSLFEKISFDDKTFFGFHLYDTDICFQTLRVGYKVCVCSDVLMEHCSMGLFNTSYSESYKLLDEKWRGHLPFVRGLSEKERGERHFVKWLNARAVLITPEKARMWQVRRFFRVYCRVAPDLKSAFRVIAREEKNGTLSHLKAAGYRLRAIWHIKFKIDHYQRSLNLD